MTPTETTDLETIDSLPETASEPAHTHTQEPAQPTMNPELMREVDVQADADAVSRSFREVVRKYQRMARIPGFRVGKVPETVIKNRFSKEVREEVLEQLVAGRFQQAIEESGMRPVSQPQLTNLVLVDGQPLQFKAAFEVMPEIDLDGYSSVAVTRPESALTDAEFKAELDRVLEPHATVEPVEEDRPLADGDWAEIEFKGQIQETQQLGEQAAGDQAAGDQGVGEKVSPEADAEQDNDREITGEDVMIEVGGANTLPAFSDALRGSRPGQEMTFEVTYPQEFGEARLAGQTVKYDVNVKSLKRKTFPEQDEEFARQFGDYSSWEAFVSGLREQAQAQKTRALEARSKDEMLNELIARYTFPVPETFVQQQIDARLDRGLRSLAQQGMTAEDMRKLDFNRLRAAQRDQAVSEVKASLILDRIAELENIEVPEEEVDRELMIASIQTREPEETLRERMTQDGSLGRMREQMRREKTGTALFERLAH